MLVIQTQKNIQMKILYFILPSVIAIIVALIAFAGSLITIKASKIIIEKQIESAKQTAELTFRQNVLSANRQEWIENLRSKISSLASKMILLTPKDDFAHEKFREVFELAFYIELMLNTNDERDKKLANLLMELIEIPLIHKEDSGAQIGKIQREIIDQTKIILKSEWERVKKGE
jgi:hypothetical protein